MNIEIKKGHPIDISFEGNTAPTINVDSKNKVEATLEKKDFNYYLHKHPEIQIFFESTFVGGGSGNSSIEILTPTEWTELTEKDSKTIYMIVDGNELKRLYIGQFLIGRSQEDGSIGFPYNFPIIF